MSITLGGTNPAVTFPDGTIQNTSANLTAPYTSNGVVYASSTTALSTGSALTFDGTNLSVTSPSTATTFTLSDNAGRLVILKNSLGTGGTAEVGTTTNHDFYVRAGVSSGGLNSLNLQAGGVTGYSLNYAGVSVWSVGGSEKMRLDSSGNLGVGVTNPSGYGKFIASGSGGTHIAVRNTDTGSASVAKTFIDLYGTNSSTVEKLQATLGSSPGLSATSGGCMVFYTNDSSSTQQERARIDESGNLLVGTSTGTTNGGYYFAVGSSSTFDTGHATGTASGATFQRYTYAGSVIGSITQSGTTSVLYNVTSDQRLKENIVDAPEFGGIIDSLQVRSFDWKTDHTHQRAGFIAQELVTVAPEAVHQPVNEEDMMAVDYSKLVPMLVKEVQSLRKRILTLESK